MKPDETRILEAIKRNLTEANNAILKVTARNKLCAAGFTYTGISFFEIALQAIYNDMIAGAIRIFDDHKEAGSLWYIIRCKEREATKAAATCGIDIEALKKIVPKLRIVRDKTHFHIDRRSVENPALVWKDADISGGELANALHNAALLLAKIKQEIDGEALYTVPEYDGSDVQEIVDAYMAARKLMHHG